MTGPRALEGIKDELLALSGRTNATGYKRSEADIHAICELAEALRDAIVEYQVSAFIEVARYRQNSLLTQQAVRTAKGNIRTELQIDCKLLIASFETVGF